MHTAIYRLILVAYLGLLLPSPLLATQGLDPFPDLTIRSLTNDHLILEYQPMPMEVTPIKQGDGLFHLIRIPYCGSSDQIGAPQLPLRRILLGIPRDGQPSVVVEEAIHKVVSGYRLVPLRALDAPPDEDLESNPAAQAGTALFPAQLVSWEEAGYLRDQRVLALTIAPLQYRPATATLYQYQRIVVTIRFPRGGSAPALSTPDPLEAVYRQALLNYEQARPWRRPVQSRVGRPGLDLSKPLDDNPFSGSDRWYRIEIREEGLYRLSYDLLEEAGLPVDTLDPHTFRLYHGGRGPLPQDLDQPRPTLQEVALYVAGEADARFDEGDYLLFYGTATQGWRWSAETGQWDYVDNPYTDRNVYWLTYGGMQQGRRMASREARPEATVAPITAVQVPYRGESNRLNPLKSGTDWFWQAFEGAFREEISHHIQLAGVAANGQVSVRLRFAGKSGGDHRVQAFLNGQLVQERSWRGTTTALLEGSGTWLQEGDNHLFLVVPRDYNDPNRLDQVYFDWFELVFWQALDGRRGPLGFFQPEMTGIPVYQINWPDQAEPWIVEVTDPLAPMRLSNPLISNNRLTFQGRAGSASVRPRYYLASPDQWRTPLEVQEAQLAGLRNPDNSADYLLVTHADFLAAAQLLKSHREKQGYRVKIVTTRQIYDEFAWGLFDPTAIRDFLRYAYQNWSSSGSRPAYVLLLGDGTYDYRNFSGQNPANWVPPFESGERCTDDWFVYFDGNGNPAADSDQIPDLAIGRIPVQSLAQAQAVVAKIIDYEEQSAFAPWRNTILLVADDEVTNRSVNETVHIQDTEFLFRTTIPSHFEVSKVYLTEFSRDVLGKKPGARQAILDQINQGALLVNWVGHGAADQWAHEDVLNVARDLPALDNASRLPLIYAATCTNGRFELVGSEAMAETFLRLPERGVIGFIGATRLSFPYPNALLNRNFYRQLANPQLTAGTALLVAKLLTGSHSGNSEKYLLFGDPALQLNLPRQQVRINTLTSDTLYALGQTAIEGEIVGQDQQPATGFSGPVFVKVRDSARETRYTTASGATIRYLLAGAPLFRGRAEAVNGRFNLAFVVPKDVTYGGSLARIVAYGSDYQGDAAGALDSLKIRGTVRVVADSLGPQIELAVENITPTDGADPVPTLHARLFDESGINLTGEVGHQIIITFDDDSKTRMDVTASFYYDTGSYQQGTLTRALPNDMRSGVHRMTLKAWDNFNNPASASLTVSLDPPSALALRNALNYPNPFSEGTTITYELTHEADVTIKIYTVAGRLVQILENVSGHPGFNQQPWDGRDQNQEPLANGTYLYKIVARSRTLPDKRAEAIGKMIMMR